MQHDSEGQPLTVTWADYLLPTVLEVPQIGILRMESPTPLNPLGVKGAGESGTIPATVAILSAEEDALSPFGVRINAACGDLRRQEPSGDSCARH